MIKKKELPYSDRDRNFKGYYAIKEGQNELKPAILVFPDWSGRNNFACEKADKLAELGYIGFAVDMYGDGITGQTKEEKSALIAPLLKDRNMLQHRVKTALEAVKKIPEVDAKQIGAIGFCFGGLCALDLARSGAHIKGVVSFHGLLISPNLPEKSIKAKILALHGYDDPMVLPDQLIAFGDEMKRLKADWELVVYGNTMHGFTNPEANDPIFGTVYNAKVTNRAWLAMQEFFKECFD